MAREALDLLDAEMNPYTLPEGNVQIAFSGGRTSAYMLRHILDANGGLPDRAVVTFQNTGREMPETLDFVREVGARWGVPIVWLEYRPTRPWFEIVNHNSASRNGEPFDALIKKEMMIPNMHQKRCSIELKSKTAKRYLVSCGWKKWTSAVGFRNDERHRQPFSDNRQTGWLPLRDAGVSRHTVSAFWRSQKFDLRLPLIGGKTIGGNCDGCFLKSEAYLSALARDKPERAAWWEAHEAKAGHKFSARYSRAELRDFMDRQGDAFDTLVKVGALCQANDGECTG
jgi:3'-phosphoadenosine 5'-phosphosulfate sulfotransferase (PAPS reductase)/FAD synthetase